ncbi:MAG: sulfotransferase family protein [Dongiaceae bacterium]
MSLRVIGAGFGRTGTLSLKLALEQLGYSPCHHMEEVLKRPDQIAHWDAAAAGRPVDWHAVFDGFRATVDWPSAHYWRELAAAFPDAKVILTTRPAEKWWASFSETIAKIPAMRAEITNPHLGAVMDMANIVIAEQTFGGNVTDKDRAIAIYEQHGRDVRNAIPADRLLVFSVAEGWAPLCRFLDKPVQQGDFPRTNSTKEFWDLVK